MRFLFTLIAISVASIALHGQQTTFSEPIDLPLTGWNKVLQTSNGNTVVFHLEPKKAIVVKIFNKDHQEVASESFIGKTIDHNLLEHSDIHGVYEIGGQAVIFLKQTVLAKETLMRLCFDTETGRIIEEEVVLASKSIAKELTFHLVHNPVSGGYAVFGMIDIGSNFKGKLYLHVFNDKHEEVQKIQIKKKTSGYDYLKHLNTSIDKKGNITISIVFRKIIKYPYIMDNDLVISHLAAGDTAFRTTETKLAKDAMPHYAMCAFDEFGHNLNYVYVDAFTADAKNGLDKSMYWIVYNSILLQYSFYDLGKMNFNMIKHQKILDMLGEATNRDSVSLTLVPIAPISFSTNKYGMSTLISEIIHEGFRLPQTGKIYANVGSIIITQINSSREEVWSTIIPKAQIAEGRLTGSVIKDRNVRKYLFREQKSYADWEQQFVSFFDTYSPRRNTFIIYNDSKKNIDAEYQYIDTVYDCTKAQGVLCTINRKKEVSRTLLYKQSDENKGTYSSMIESADYDEDKLIYCSLVLHQEGDNKELLMGWTVLEDE